MVHGSALLSSAVGSIRQSNKTSSNHQEHEQQQRHRGIHNHPSFIDAVTLLTLALRLASNDIHTFTRGSVHRQSGLSSQKPSDTSSSAWAPHTCQLPIWPNGSGSSIRAKLRAWSLDSLALAAYSLNDYAYSATLLCQALRCGCCAANIHDALNFIGPTFSFSCEGCAGDEEERCVYSHHLTCCLSMLARHDHAHKIGRSVQVILKRRLRGLIKQASGTRG